MPNSKKIFVQSQNMLYFTKFMNDVPEDFDDLLLACNENQTKTQATVQSLYYLSETFLPPRTLNKPKATSLLREAFEIDSLFQPVIDSLSELGVDVQQLPSLNDPFLLRCFYWINDKIPFDFQIQFANYLREKALQDYREEYVSAASKSFGNLITIFPKSVMNNFSSEQHKTGMNFIVTTKSNYLK
jgi:hypothetical protein